MGRRSKTPEVHRNRGVTPSPPRRRKKSNSDYKFEKHERDISPKAERRRSPEQRRRSPEQRSRKRTPEPRKRTPELRKRTPEPRKRSPEPVKTDRREYS